MCGEICTDNRFEIIEAAIKAWNKYFGCTITKPTDEEREAAKWDG